LVINHGKLIAAGDIKTIMGEGTLEEAFLRLTQGAER